MVMPYHLHMPSYFLETFTEYPYVTWFLEPDTALFFKIIIIKRSVILYEHVEDNIAISLKTFFQSFQ